MQKHQREVVEYLRHEYGVKDAHLEFRGKHPRLLFTHNGAHHILPMTSSPSDVRTIYNIRADLHRMLGETNTSKPKQSRSLEDMMSELNTSTAIPPREPPPIELIDLTVAPEPAPLAPASQPAKSWAIKAAGYKTAGTGCSVWFLFPPEIRTHFPDGVTIERLDDEHWKLTAGGAKRFIDYANKVKLTHAEKDIGTFGIVPAEAVMDGSEMLIYVSKANRPPVYHSATATPVAQQPYQPAKVQAPVSPAVVAQAVQITLEARMRLHLDETRAIERLCPYKFVRLDDGRVAWEAPRIE